MPVPETQGRMSERSDLFTSGLADMERAREKFISSSDSMTKKMEDSWRRGISDNGRINFGQTFGEDTGTSIVEGDKKLVISLNTSGYKPSELTVNVEGEDLSVEGRHEERSEAGEVMVSRQFTRSFSLPQGALKEKVESSLGQDGVLVITVPKENKIQEIKNGEQLGKIKFITPSDANKRKSPSPLSTISTKSSSTFSSSGSSSKGCDADKNKMNESHREYSPKDKKDDWPPITLRDSFFNKDSFDEEWKKMEKSQEEFLANSRKQFDESVRKMRANMETFTLEFDSDNFDNSTFEMPQNNQDNHDLSYKESPDKLEIKVDTTGYKPDELRVTAGSGVICVEARHEEKTEKGVMMVSRMMSRQYPLPAQARPSDVVSNLSRDGVLVVTVPKSKQIKQDERNVPISVEK